MAGMTEVSKRSGINQEKIQDVFAEITKLVASGETVKIHGFGTFERKVFKGRTLNTPLLAKPVTYADSFVLKFHQSALAKQQLNAMAKGEEPPAAVKKGPKPKAKPEPEETEEVDVPAKKAPVKKAVAKKELPAKEEKPAKAAPKKAEPAPKAATPLKKKAAPPPPEEEEEEDDEEDLDEDEGDEDEE